jgi:thiol-disulfide isomerase/thioredoxin
MRALSHPRSLHASMESVNRASVPGLTLMLILGLLGGLGCSRHEDAPPSQASNAPSAKPSSGGAPLVLAQGVRFVKPGPGDVALIVRSESAVAEQDGRKLIVYVGATWCEPCQRFHKAAQQGELDAEFPNLNILELDADDDHERAAAAGYRSRLIPLFVRPGPDGRATARRFEGGVKGDGAVAQLAPRLKTLLQD